MRKQGVDAVRTAIANCINSLQEEVRSQAAGGAPAASGAPARPPPPVPQPIKVETVAPGAAAPAPAPAAPAPRRVPVRSASDSDSDSDGRSDEEPPPLLAAALRSLKRSGSKPPTLRLSNAMILDCHVSLIVDALGPDTCNGVTELDLSFNRLTDAGIHVLLKARPCRDHAEMMPRS